MNIDLKILHLCRALHYVPTERPGCVGEKTLEGLASQFEECLLAFGESTFSVMTDDGPRLSATLVPEAAYRVATGEEPFGFSFAAGDYVFFQWRAHSEHSEPEQSPPSSFSTVLEEVVRETWWQRLECGGPWFVRLISEDEKVAIQALWQLKKAP